MARRATGTVSGIVHPRLSGLVPPLLSFIAGFVDSCGFLGLFGLFTAQVTGSFVVAGAELVTSEAGSALKLLAIPVYFVAAALAGLLIRTIEQRGTPALPWVLLLDAALIGAFVVAGLVGSPMTNPDAPAAIVAGVTALSAMGVQSATARLLIRGAGPTTFMTGNTTQLAIDTVDFLLARAQARRDPGNRKLADRATGSRHRLVELARLLLGFLLGAAIGAILFAAYGFISAAVAITLTLAIAIWAFLGGAPRAG
ncbi:MAG TPA: YoaK family protein [Xanthobacteraceae bacterium]|nr:YoaK family protein [Xanthobacteraceae bacterium]